MKNQYRKPIGFKVTDNKLAVIEQQQSSFTKTNDVSFEQMMQLKGLEQGLELLKLYFNSCYMPLVPNRDAYFFEELKKIKHRFYEPLL